MGNTESGISNSPTGNVPSPAPIRFTSAARKMVTTVPASEIQKRFERDSMERTNASAGIDKGLIPA